MATQWNSVLIAISLFILAIPYVAFIRKPYQNKLAIYFVFVISFVVVSAAIFMLMLFWLSQLGIGILLSQLLYAFIFISIVFLPSLVIATWLARRSP